MLADDRARKAGDRPKGSAREGGVRARPEGREEKDEKRDARGARHGCIQGKRQGESLGGKREKRRKVCEGRIGRTMGVLIERRVVDNATIAPDGDALNPNGEG